MPDSSSQNFGPIGKSLTVGDLWPRMTFECLFTRYPWMKFGSHQISVRSDKLNNSTLVTFDLGWPWIILRISIDVSFVQPNFSPIVQNFKISTLCILWPRITLNQFVTLFSRCKLLPHRISARSNKLQNVRKKPATGDPRNQTFCWGQPWCSPGQGLYPTQIWSRQPLYSKR